MRKLYRLLLGVSAGLIVLLLLAVAGALFLASRSLPDYDADFQVRGVASPVEILRDRANVPYISGSSDTDVFFGLGFAHAQDRLWQMTLLRRTAQGRLSEIFGADTIQTDILMRQLDLYGLAQEAVESQDPETRAALSAYAAGVNAWLTEINRGALGRGAPEFFLFGGDIAPWQPADSLAIAKLLAVQQSPGPESEILRAQLSLVLPADRVEDLMPAAPGPAITALPDYAALFPSLSGAWPAQEWSQADPSFPVARNGSAAASNAWAAGPTRSISGASLMANDPHSTFTVPSQWYLASLQLGAGAVIGATVPGVPFVLLGRSDRFGWGFTASYMDDLDIYIEKLNPDDPDQYLSPEGFQNFETRQAIIEVADAAPVTVTLRWTENGPVIPGSLFGLEAITPEGHVTSFAWSALSRADTTPSAMLRMMKADSVQAGVEAGALWRTPAVNLVLADPNRVALQMVGAIPRRSVDHQTEGRMPAPGWLPQNRWSGTLPYSTNPQILDPAEDLVGNTNNRTTDRAFPEHVSFDWGDTQRIRRLRDLMAERPIHSRDSFMAAQLDTVSVTARTLLPLIGGEFWFTSSSAPEGTIGRRRQEALDLLANWNGDMNEHLAEPLIYSVWIRALQKRLLSDEIGPLADAFNRPSPIFLERVFRDLGGAAAWCDIRATTAIETCTEMASLALDDALLWIDETYPGDMATLQWGDAHVARLDNPTLGRLPYLRWLFNLRVPVPGDDDTLWRTATEGMLPRPFESVSGAGYRGIYDFGDPDASLFIISSGQSGHPLSRFYDNLGELWRRGEYIPMSTDPDIAKAGAVGVTWLRPAR